jgi:hypothetical protein
MPFSIDSTESVVAGTYYPPVATQANPACTGVLMIAKKLRVLSDRRFRKPRIAIGLLAAPQLLCGDKSGPDQFAAPPGPKTNPDNRAAGREGHAENLGHRQRPDVEAHPAFGDIDDEAFDPRRVRGRDDEARPAVFDPFVLALAKVFTVSRHTVPSS